MAKKKQYYLVHVTRVSTYRVKARDEEHAITVRMDTDPEDVDTETTNMDAELDPDQEDQK